MKKRQSVFIVLIAMIMLVSSLGLTPVAFAANTVTTIKITTKVKNCSYGGTDSDVILVLYDAKKSTEETYKLDKKNHNDFEKGKTDTYTVTTSMYAWQISEMRIQIEGKDCLRLEKADWEVSCGNSKKTGSKNIDVWMSKDAKEGVRAVNISEKDFNREITSSGNFTSTFNGTEYFDINDTSSGSVSYTWNCKSTDQYIKDANPYDLPHPPELSYRLAGTGEKNGVITDAASDAALASAVTAITNSNKDVIGYTVNKQALLNRMKSTGLYKVSIVTTLSYPTNSTNNTKGLRMQIVTRTYYRSQFRFNDKDTALLTTAYKAATDNLFYNSTSNNVTARIAVTSDTKYMGNYSASAIAQNLAYDSVRLYYGKGANDYVEARSKLVSGNIISFNFDISSVKRNNDNAGMSLSLKNVRSTYDSKPYRLEGTDYTKQFTSNKVDTLAPQITVVPDDSKSISGVWRKGLSLSSSVNEEIYPKLTSTIAFKDLPFNKNVYTAELTGPSTKITKTVPATSSNKLKFDGTKNVESDNFTLKLSGYDFAGNPTTVEYKNIYLDNKAPSVSVDTLSGEQQTDNSKVVLFKFKVEELSGTARIHYCFVRKGDAVPEVNNESATSGSIDALIGRWAFVEQNDASALTVSLRIKEKEEFDGDLYYYAEDALGNVSERKVLPIFESNISAEADLRVGNYDHPLKNYDITFDCGKDTNVYYRYFGVNSRYKLYEPGKSNVGSGVQINDNGVPVTLNGKQILEYKAVNSVSGNTVTFEGAKGKVLVFDNADTDINMAQDNTVPSKAERVIKIKAEDISGVVDASYKVYTEDKSKAVTSKKNLTINNGIVSDSAIVSGLDNGRYILEVTAVDANGDVTVSDSSVFNIRSKAPTVSASIENAKNTEGNTLINSHDYNVVLNVEEEYACAKNNETAQVVKYRASCDGINFGAWEEAGELSQVTNGFGANNVKIKSPIPLIEGLNTLYLQVVCVERTKDLSNVTGMEPSVLTLEPINLCLDTTAPSYNVIYENSERTNNPVSATVILSDNYTTSLDLTGSEDEVEIIPSETEENVFTVIASVPQPTLFTSDDAGNTSEIKLPINNIDVEAPIVEFSEPQELSVGSRTDATFTVKVYNVDPSKVSFSAVRDGEDFEESISSDDIKNVSVIESYDTYAPDGIKTDAYTKCMEYTVELKGMTGLYQLGIIAKDDLGNEAIALSDSVMLVDERASLTNVNAPAKAIKNASAELSFNVPVYVLPLSQMITDDEIAEKYGADETRDADEINMDNAVLEALRLGTKQTTTYNFPENADGKYRFAVSDDVGRASIIECEINTEFIEGTGVDVELVQCKTSYDYSQGFDVEPVETREVVGEDDIAIVGYDESDPDKFSQAWVEATVTTKAPEGVTVFFYPYPLDDNGNEIITDTSYSPETPFSLKGASGGFYEEAPDGTGGYTKLLMDIMSYDFYTYEVKESPIKTLNFGSKVFVGDLTTPVIQNYSIPFTNIITEKPDITLSVSPETDPTKEVNVRVSATGKTSDVKSLRAEEQIHESGAFDDIIREKEEEFGDDEEGFNAWLSDFWEHMDEYAKNYMLDVTDENNTLEFKVNRNTMYSFTATNEYGLSSSEWINVENIITDALDEEDINVSYEIKRNDQWVEDDGISYAKEARAVITTTDDMNKRRVYAKNNGGSMEKLLTSEYPTFSFDLADAYGYELSQVVSFDRFDPISPTITYAVDNTEKTNKPVNVTINATDNESGLENVELKKIGTSEPIELTQNGDEYTASLAQSGNYVITAKDAAGNVASASFNLSNIDTNAPTSTYTLDTTALTRKGVTATVVFSKNNVALTKVEPVVGGSLKPSDITYDLAGRKIRFTNNGSVAIEYVDDYGNTGTDIITVTNIFTDPPSLIAVPVLADDEQSVSVTFDKQKNGEGVPLDMIRELTELYVFYGGTAYKVMDDEGNPATFVLRQNGDYVFTVYDEAGSMQYITLTVSDIDTSAPRITQLSWEYDYFAEGSNGFNEHTETGTYIPAQDELGYIIASDKHPKTNQSVEIKVTTDKPTSFMGGTGETSTEHVFTYKENGLFIFNLKKSDDLSVSYGVDVELIDKTPPAMSFKNNSELMYLQGATEYKKSDLMDATAYDVFANVTTDLTNKITIDWGGFDPDNFEANTFNKNKPYTITYTVYDNVGNKTELKRKLILIGVNDTVMTVNGSIPDANMDIVIDKKDVTLGFINFSGVSYAKYTLGNYTFGQMKTIGAPIAISENGTYKVENLQKGWYTFFVQTDKRDYFNIHVYVN